MKFTGIALALLLATNARAWNLEFYSDFKHIKTHGTERGVCHNLRSSYDEKTKMIYFNPSTPSYPDPKGYTAYSKADCKGNKYYGSDGWQYPDKNGDGTRFRSYRVTKN
ncbi:hypothetical protein HZ326_30962 [Fusarium oxysporum f. sp. albedinis]|jgi:hypothetical protein|nr:hypothetical protein HZ326_30962 [Fusarium oxysporum f. sp. albedinis]KAK2471597.1 hypothetical protein H9L39_16588 [Fusarium oxysporum f. sp. albedinis]